MNTTSNKIAIFVKVIGQVLFLYGLLAWLDGVVIQFTNPMWLAMPVSHLFLWIRTDTFTILSYILSAFGLFMWRLAVELTKPQKEQQK
jgi:hypothetical protein